MPTKKSIINSWTINWIRDTDIPDLEEITNGFSSFNKGIDEAGVKAKIENTIAYYTYIKENVFTK